LDQPISVRNRQLPHFSFSLSLTMQAHLSSLLLPPNRAQPTATAARAHVLCEWERPRVSDSF
jgi:hypothetical protein